MTYLRLTLFVAAMCVTMRGTALADNCSIGGVSRVCDIVCQEAAPGGPHPCNVPSTHASCDDNNDGWCTICGQFGSHDTDQNTSTPDRRNSIQGTPGKDWICGRDGEDILRGNDADDVISGGDHDDDIEGNNGDDDLRGDNNNDELYGGDGHDRVDGGSGNDTISEGDGENVLIGGTGNDSITVTTADPIHDALGNIICGGSGFDTLTGTGDGHTCFDGGTDTGGDDTCTYTSPGDDNQDVATKINCEIAFGTFEPQTRECGCP